jgi:hypothetical protein
MRTRSGYLLYRVLLISTTEDVTTYCNQQVRKTCIMLITLGCYVLVNPEYGIKGSLTLVCWMVIYKFSILGLGLNMPLINILLGQRLFLG